MNFTRDGIDQSELNIGRLGWRPLSIAPTVTRGRNSNAPENLAKVDF
jgi:hypothetical protein